MRAMHAIWAHRSQIGLVGNHIDVLKGKWTAIEAGIGAGVDSYYEYLVKGATLLQRPELMTMFKVYTDFSLYPYFKTLHFYPFTLVLVGGARGH